MKAVRFTKAEAEAVNAALNQAASTGTTKAITGALQKMTAAAAPEGKAPIGLSVATAVRVMEGVLGVGNLALPETPSGRWFGQVGTVIKRLGLTEEQCRTIAQTALATNWRMPVPFETLVWNATRLLTQAKNAPKPRAAPLAPDGL